MVCLIGEEQTMEGFAEIITRDSRKKEKLITWLLLLAIYRCSKGKRKL